MKIYAALFTMFVVAVAGQATDSENNLASEGDTCNGNKMPDDSTATGTAHLANTTHAPIVRKLEVMLKADSNLELAVVTSLKKATSLAASDLNADLYAAIDEEFNGNGWPATAQNYLDYLDQYVHLVPHERDEPDYPNAWKSNDQQNGHNQKIYDLLCQFYWLVNQTVEGASKTLQDFDNFAEWLVDFAIAWGSFLDTPLSLSEENLLSFKQDTKYNFQLYADQEPSWKTFNNFFYREFNDAAPGTGITPLRPIAAPDDNTIIVAPADCTFKEVFPIDSEGNVLDESGQKTKINLKHTHSIGTVDELLDNSPYAEKFYGGTFVHYFLSPFEYHRFHTPVGGKVVDIRPTKGQVFLDVEMTSDGQWNAPDNAGGGYEFNQARGLVIVDTNSTVGLVATLPIGMCQVSGVDMYLNLQDKIVPKGQEFGKFRFGGSDIIMAFEKPPQDLYLFMKDPGQSPIHFQYGQTAVYWNN